MIVAVIMSLPILYVAPELLPAGLGAIALAIVVLIITTVQERRLAMRQFESAERNAGMVFDLFSGAQRLKLSGSEGRAYARWIRGYVKQAAATYSTKFPLCARVQLVTTCRLIGLLVAFYLAFTGHVSVASFGKLFAGDIYSNITITAPHLGIEEAWDAAEKVGMADDIRRMPMGMHTRIAEG